MRVEILDITPLMAMSYLERNNSNRKINKNQLSMLVRSMLNNQWRLTHQGVAFYEDGELADGQHRLSAIVESGCTVKMPVFFGVERDTGTVMAIDSGRGRTITDSSRIAGSEIKNKDIAVALGLEYGYKRAFEKLSYSESLELHAKYKDDLTSIGVIFPKNKRFISIAPVKVACARALRIGIPFPVVKNFVDTLYSGEYSEAIYSNAVKLRNKLMLQNYNGGAERPVAHDMTLNTLRKTNDGIIVKIVRAA